MKKMFLASLIVLFAMVSCNNDDSGGASTSEAVNSNAESDSAGTLNAPPPSPYIVQKTIAWEMMHLYRDKKVKIKDASRPSHEDKNNIAASFTHADHIAAIANAKHISIIAAAYKENHDTKKLIPTLLLRIVPKNSTKAEDTTYYFPVKESLCPPPDDCN